MKRPTRKTLICGATAVLAAVALLVAPPDADAAQSRPEPPPSGKSFNWSFTGTCCITSRQFTTTVRAPVTVTSVLEPCETRFGRVEYAVGLWRGATFVGAKQLTCWGSAAWKAQRAGSYRFRLAIMPPWRDSQTFTGYGTVNYNGARS